MNDPADTPPNAQAPSSGKAAEDDPFQHRKFANQTTLFEEGDLGEAAYLVVTGRIEIRVGTASGDPRTIAIVGPGDVVGEMALFDDRPRTATAVTVDDCELIEIGRDAFQQRVERMNPVMRRILTIMVSRVRSMTDEFIRRKAARGTAKG